MPHKSRRAQGLLVLGVSLAACSDSPISSIDTPGPPQPASAIVDAAHSGQVPGFYFLPPMVPDPGAQGAVDLALAPTVGICALDTEGTTCATDQPIGFPIQIDYGAGGVELSSDFYRASWKTSDYDLDEQVFYRITIQVGNRELGYADVDVVDNGNQLRNVDTGQYIALKDGRTLPIKFRIESGILGALTVTPTMQTIAPFDEVELTAIATDLHGMPLEQLTLGWSVADALLVSLDGYSSTSDASGTATVVASASGALGQTTVQVAAQGLEAEATVVVAYPPPPVSGLLAHWPFDGSAVDATGNGHDGTVIGAVLTQDRFGRVDHAYDFDGADDRIVIGDYFGALAGLTISAWVEMDAECLALNKWCTIVSKTIQGAYQQNFQKTFSLAKVPFAGTTNWFNMRVYGPDMFDAIDVAYSGPMQSDRWYHLVASYDAQDVRLYLDGVLIDVTQRIGNLHVNTTPLVIGAIASGGNVMDGVVDDIRVYGRALDPQEVLLLYNEAPNN